MQERSNFARVTRSGMKCPCTYFQPNGLAAAARFSSSMRIPMPREACQKAGSWASSCESLSGQVRVRSGTRTRSQQPSDAGSAGQESTLAETPRCPTRQSSFKTALAFLPLSNKDKNVYNLRPMISTLGMQNFASMPRGETLEKYSY